MTATIGTSRPTRGGCLISKQATIYAHKLSCIVQAAATMHGERIYRQETLGHGAFEQGVMQARLLDIVQPCMAIQIRTVEQDSCEEVSKLHCIREIVQACRGDNESQYESFLRRTGPSS